ncbi:MAG: hypothetical protein HRT68_01835 [Flavobacteriaceae bacterium]|nr:hypothetical protein [Flavobacteriaceae bacterium]
MFNSLTTTNQIKISSYPRNLIIIGNGFDLAHNLNTSYNDFVSYLGSEALKYLFGSR